MCWIGYKSDLKIAKKDVKVLKAIYIKQPTTKGGECRYFAPLTCFEYTLNKLYEIDQLEPNPTKTTTNNKIKIDVGLHSFSLKSDAKEKIKHSRYEWLNGRHIIINEYIFRAEKMCLTPIAKIGTNKSVVGPLRLALLECIIPAGTKYYENKFGEIVSNKLIVTDKERKV